MPCVLSALSICLFPFRVIEVRPDLPGLQDLLDRLYVTMRMLNSLQYTNRRCTYIFPERR